MGTHGCRSPTLPAGLLIGSLSSTPLPAQTDSACTWDTCALRLHRSLFGWRIVRGLEGEKVAGLGWFVGDLPLLAERSDTAATLFRSYRGKQNSGTVISLISMVVTAVGVIVWSTTDDDGLGLASRPEGRRLPWSAPCGRPPARTICTGHSGDTTAR